MRIVLEFIGALIAFFLGYVARGMEIRQIK